MMKHVIWLVLLLVPAAVLAQTNVVTDDDVNEVAKDMYCTECENITLDVCGTQACIQWRAEIRRQLEEGRTEEEIVAYFVSNYGERAVGAPRDPFLRAMSLWTPIVAGLLALVGAVWVLRKWQEEAPSAVIVPPSETPPSVADSDDYVTRLEQDLR